MPSPKPPPVPSETYCLGLLASEMGEALQIIGNALRFGLMTPEKGEMPASELLVKELGDVQAAIRFASIHGFVDWQSVEKHSFDKLNKLLDGKQRDNLGRRLAPKPPA